MRILFLLIISLLPALADNSVTITNETESTQSSYTYKVARYFASGEINDYPKPRIGGAPAAYWQSEVKTRWDNGSVRFAVIYFEATIAGSNSITVDFVNDLNPNNGGGGLTKTGMLDFNAGGGSASWGCGIQTIASSVTLSASCRTMLSDDQYQVLESGPLATTVLIREGPQSVAGGTTRNYSFGYHCTANCSAPYDTATWVSGSTTYQSMRPSFVVTFYPRWGRVRTHFILDNGWTDRLQDQRFELVLLNGGSETNQVYDSSAAVVLPARGRIFEEYWSTTPGLSSQNLNTEYMESTKVIPEYGTRTISAQAVALEKAQFDGTDQGATVGAAPPHLGWGQWTRNMGTAGGRPDLGVEPRWTARLLNSWDKDLWTVVLGNAKAMMHASFWYLEYDSARNYCSTSDCDLGGGTITAFGRPISNDSRPDMAYHANRGTAPVDDVPSPVGTVTVPSSSDNQPWTVSTANTVNAWQLEMAHPPEAFAGPYLVTGDYVYLEALQAWAQFRMLINPAHNPATDRNLHHYWSLGILSGLMSREEAWSMRDLANAALFSTGGTPESNYFNEKLQNNLAWMEGVLHLTHEVGNYAPSTDDAACSIGAMSTLYVSSETDPWCLGRWGSLFNSNPLHWPLFKRSLPYPEGMDGDTAWNGARQWMDNYLRIILGRIAELYPEAGPISKAVSTTMVHLVLDSNYDLMWQASSYNIPVQSSNENFLNTYADVRNGYVLSAHVARAVAQGSTILYVTGLPSQYWGMDWGTFSVLSVDSEQVYGTSGVTGITDSCAVNAGTDVFTCSSHPFQDGDMLKLVATAAPSGTINGHDYFVDVLDANTLKLCTTAACSAYVDPTSAGSSVKLGMMYASVHRAYSSTTDVAHSPGENVTFIGRTVIGGSVAHNYGMIFRAALSFAPALSISTMDEGNAATLTASDAWSTFDAAISGADRFGNNTNCGNAGLSVDECDNPTWGLEPREYSAQPLAVAFASCPNGAAGVSYSCDLTATGGTAPYSWDLYSGDICTGLALQSSGVIAGTPALAGPCSFTVRVTDAGDTIATRALSISIRKTRGAARVGPGAGSLR